MDIPTLITLTSAIVTALIWLGRQLIKATRAAVGLTSEMRALRKDLHRKADRDDLEHWIERLGYLNEGVKVPSLPRQEPAEAA